jgi:non-specific serine/threonine protein kinase
LGRDQDIASVTNLLATDGVQIVTLLGPGGIGKSRLAIAVAERGRTSFADGVRFASLASIRDAALAPAVIAHALGIREQAGTPYIDRLAAIAGDLHLLLVIDNLEHLPDTAPVLARIAERCPGVRLLCTSRTRLDISGELVHVVQPLPSAAAIELFTQRAGAISPRFRDGTHDRQTIADLCERLDRLPLAIELAAARVPVLSPGELLQGLHDRFSMLAPGPRDGSDRHHDLRSAIAWSHDLLDDHDRALFRRLAVFSGGFTLDSARSVVRDGTSILDGMARLEASSLVQQVAGDGAVTRLTLLESVREFALEQLAAGGELDGARRAHATHFVRVFDGSDRLWWFPEGLERLNLIEAEIANVRAALAWLREAGEIEDFLRLAGAAGALWASRGYSQEGREHLEWGLARSAGVPRDVVMVATWALSWILNQHDEGYLAFITGLHALDIAEDAADPVRLLCCLMITGVGAYRHGLFERSIAIHQRILTLLDEHDHEAWIPIARCITMNQLGIVHLHLGMFDRAESWFNRALGHKEEHHLTFTHGAHSLMGLGDVARARGDAGLALERYQAALPDMRHVHDVRARAYVVAAIAGALAAAGRYDLAGTLFGASEAEHERIAFAFVSHTWNRLRAFGLPEPWSGDAASYGIHETLFRTLEHQSAAIRNTSLDPDLARRWWAEGRGMPFDEAMAIALSAVSAPPAAPALPGGLSAREVDVLRLLARGLTDDEIARTLSISRRTASNHVHHIYSKLNVGSRAAATAWAAREGLA